MFPIYQRCYSNIMHVNIMHSSCNYRRLTEKSDFCIAKYFCIFITSNDILSRLSFPIENTYHVDIIKI